MVRVKTYAHISASLAVAGLAVSVGVPWKPAVVSALIGGEALDVIDYPIFFLSRTEASKSGCRLRPQRWPARG